MVRQYAFAIGWSGRTKVGHRPLLRKLSNWAIVHPVDRRMAFVGWRTHGTLSYRKYLPRNCGNAVKMQHRCPTGQKRSCKLLIMNGGEGGIRTHGTREGSTVFETARFNRSRTSPFSNRTISQYLHRLSLVLWFTPYPVSLLCHYARQAAVRRAFWRHDSCVHIASLC